MAKKRRRRKKKKQDIFAYLFIVLIGFLIAYYRNQLIDLTYQYIVPVIDKNEFIQTKIFRHQNYDLSNIPEYSGEPYVEIKNNIPNFNLNIDYTKSFETYSNLDGLNRCGVAFANIGKDLMPTEERGSIGMVKPSGWHTIKYSGIDGNYLYNRCHLIAFELTGENDNTKNLITCTRSMNVNGMLPFENKVASYIRKTGNHVLYRVTPIFKDYDLVAIGAQMEAYSVEDHGRGIKFNIFVYNVQNGIEINYHTGDSKRK